MKWMAPAHDMRYIRQGRPRTSFGQTNDWRKLYGYCIPQHLSWVHGATHRPRDSAMDCWAASGAWDRLGSNWVMKNGQENNTNITWPAMRFPMTIIPFNGHVTFPSVNSVCQWQAICKPTSVESLADSCQDQCCTSNHSKTFPWGNAGRSNWNKCPHFCCIKGVAFHVSHLIPHTHEECPVTLQWGNTWNSCPKFFEGSNRSNPRKLLLNCVTTCILFVGSFILRHLKSSKLI